MPEEPIDLNDIRDYFDQKLQQFGTSYQGVDFNSTHSHEHRFAQLMKIVDLAKSYSLLDFGSGYGALYKYLTDRDHHIQYYGYDILETMISKGNFLYKDFPNCKFSTELEDFPIADFCVANGTFNMKMKYDRKVWEQYVIESIHKMNEKCELGFSFNLLTSYSDAELMRDDLYYGNPCFYFDYCKKNFSKNVALLHDYGLYDFTILVRKNL